MQEFISDIDWNNNVIAVHPKEKLKQQHFIHRVSLILPKTSDGKIMLCKRAKDKFPRPDTWCCAIGGKVLANESYHDAATREMIEESNFNTSLTQVEYFNYEDEFERVRYGVFTTKEPVSVDRFEPELSEVQFFKA